MSPQSSRVPEAAYRPPEDLQVQVWTGLPAPDLTGHPEARDILDQYLEFARFPLLRRVVPQAVRGILAQETPVIAAMAQSVSRQKMVCWAAAKRIYRFVENKCIHPHQLLKGMYQITRRTVAEENLDYLVVALDPVNFEKPYTKKLEG